ncbi:MAG: PA14 domain-containing protein, partial [Thermoanaerobaculia bacterium]
MRIPIPLSRSPTHQRISIGLRLVLLLLLAIAGALLVTDRPGLRAEYFALGTPWEGRPLYSTVGEPRLETASQIRQVLMTEVGFSVRWSGWWAVAGEGEHRFSLDADDGGYLRIDDELIVDSRGVFGERRKAGRKALEAGFHAVEIGLYQTLGESRLAVRWVAPGSMDESAAPLPLGDLYARRPLTLRETLRSALSFWPRTYRQLLGAALLLAAVLMVRGFAMLLEAPTAWLRALNGRGLHAALLLGLFALAFFASFPFTGTVRGGDDTAYLSAANFGNKAWFFNRYAHIYLLKFFITVSGGDPLVGVRVWWSFIFATTVAAIAVAVRSIGPGLQLRTLAVTLFVLLAQTTLFGMIGAAFADYSAMMFVTVAVAA